MTRGDWESLAGLVITPALEEAAAELNKRPGIVAAVSEHPIYEACLLWIAHREPSSPFLLPHGSFALHDEPVLPMIRVEEADSSVSAGRPLVRLYLRRSEITVSSIKAMALAFADRLPPIEDPARENGGLPAPATAAAASAPEHSGEPAPGLRDQIIEQIGSGRL
jgi:hypothetical protein